MLVHARNLALNHLVITCLLFSTQLVRCWECVKLANYKPAYVPGYKSKADMCHNFCRMLPTPRWPNMTDPSQVRISFDLLQIS